MIPVDPASGQNGRVPDALGTITSFRGSSAALWRLGIAAVQTDL